MQVKARTYVLHGVTHREEMVPHGFVVVDTYHPHTTPWDYQGNKHTGEVKRVLLDAGIESVSLVTTETNNTPHGSGPGGRVRFGDAMMPGVYRVAVPKHKAPAARVALACHQEAIDRWLHDGGEMPAACRG